ncbi:MAG: hypothetical protein P4M08_07250 [Oligoflexia bacterium]|nr:hypothetical protein [Oligoflexia bacterium]
MDTKSAIQSINESGVLLVFPIDNRKEIPSLWSHFYPRSKMRWEWDDDGDDRVARLWRLREELSRSNEVIYGKWFRGRATFFSKPVFTAMLRLMNPEPRPEFALGADARKILETLLMDSPLSTRQLKRAVELQGRFNEPTYNRALKELWSRLLAVAYGEIDEGAFPSLAIGATQILFEDLYREAFALDIPKAQAILQKRLAAGSPFLAFADRLRKKCAD